MSAVTVVIPHYFSAREPHLARIVSDLMAGTLTPVEVVIWNNDTTSRLPTVRDRPGVRILGALENCGAQARFIAVPHVTTDLILFLDNDVTVYPETVANLVRWHSALGPRAIVTLEGRQSVTTTCHYRQWTKLRGRHLAQPLAITLSLGRGELLSRQVALELIEAFPFGPRGEMDDLQWSACAAQAGVPIYVVPAQAGMSDLEDLPRFSTGISKSPDYYGARDRTIAEIRTRLAVWT